MDQSTAPVERPGFLLPDLCAPQTVLLVVMVAELVALCLVLFASGSSGFDWVALGRTSLFVQWLVLSSSALLCTLRRWLAQQPLVLAASLSYALILALCLVFSLLAELLLSGLAVAGAAIDLSHVLRNLLLCAVLAGLTLRYFYLQGELQRRQQAAMQARIEALHARIRPHFLFNSMNSIAGLIAEDPEAAERSVEDLAELFRASLRESETEVGIQEELQLCRRYLGIESHRLGSRLQVVWRTGDMPETVRVPPLSVQPLVENAVYHGIQPLPEGGEIRIEVGGRGNRLQVRVTNPLPALSSAHEQGHRMALDNIRDRLKALYGEDASLSAEHQGDRFVATMTVPVGSR